MSATPEAVWTIPADPRIPAAEMRLEVLRTVVSRFEYLDPDEAVAVANQAWKWVETGKVS